jgi:hypothetical protein
MSKYEKIKEMKKINKLKHEEYINIKLDQLGEKIDRTEKKIEQGEKNTIKKLEKIEKIQSETNNGVKKITNYIEFLNQYCLDANPLTRLSDDDINIILGIDEYNDFELESIIIRYIKNNNLHIKLGNLILSKFLRSGDPKTQQVWTSDISRLIYIILQMIGNKKSWIRDKKGEIFSELIIMPIIKRLNELMFNYAKYCIQSFNETNDSTKNILLLEHAQIAKDSTNYSYNQLVNKDILKFIASKISLAAKKNQIIELCE